MTQTIDPTKQTEPRIKENTIIEVSDLVKRYKELVAVDHLSLTVKEGQIFGLLGPNGSGKTTLIHCILALLRYDNGTVEIFGEEMSKNAAKIKQQIGLVPQEPAVYEELTVEENIDYFCGLYISDKEKRKEHVDWAIDFVQLKDFRKFHPSKLSGGLLRRLNLACDIAHRPRLIFLDEPTVAVDPQSRNSILEGIKELNRDGATVIYTSHYMEEIEFLCDQLAILDHGKVLVEGASKEIIEMSSIGETIEIVSYDITEEMVKELEERPDVVSIHLSEGNLSMQVKQGSQGLLSVLHYLEKKGVEPVSVASEQPTLNDVFLEITGKELRDHA